MTSFTTPPNLTTAQSLGGNDTGTVAAGSSLSVAGKTAVTIALTTKPTPYSGVVIANSGTIKDTNADGRAIDTSGTPAGARTVRITNDAQATITATDDAIRLNGDLAAGSQISVDNAGTISSTATGATSGQAIDFDAVTTTGSTVTITNRSSGSITAADNDAVRPGQKGDVENYGAIRSNAVAVPADQPSADGVDFGTNHTGTVHNYGSANGAAATISGARDGVAGGSGTKVTVTNDLGATITGRDGAGVGLDGSGTVTNAGTISGAIDTTSARGDGDGIDIASTAVVINTGTIQGLGAKGNDAGGRANAGEGLSIGGGSVANYGSIVSAAMNPDGATANTGGAIVVNNDAMANRSGNAATTITNYAGASITGGNGYAIRLENKGTAAVAADKITNYGTITGNGAIPDPNGIVTFVDPTTGQTVADPNSVGTLDGVAYTGTGSARFILGDGSAIQTGEGADVVTDYGAIIGNSGRAIDLEGGADTLDLYTGATVTGQIDGGAGTDTLNLRLDDRTGQDATLGANSGSVSGVLSNVVDFEILAVQGGSWTISDAEAFGQGATIATGAALQVGNGATAGSLKADVADAGALTFDRSNALSYTGTLSGMGALNQNGSGTLRLLAANTGFGGAVALNDGTLELGQQSSAGTGTITFGPGGEMLRLDANGALGASVAGFATGDTLDLAALNAAGATASYDGTTLTVVGTAAADGTAASVSLAINAAPTGKQFTISSDGNGDARVTVTTIAAPTITTPAQGTDTNDDEPMISGTGVSGDTVDLTITPKAGGTATAATAAVVDGVWSFTPATPLADDTYTIRATQTSPTGTGSSAAANRTVTVDTTAPVVSSPTLVVAQNSKATTIGITAPSDNLTARGALAIVVGALPTDGIVTLSSGSTPVTTGQTLTATQLQDLKFTPTPGASSQASTFTYSVTDEAGNAATGTAQLVVGGPGAPKITGTKASSTRAEAAVLPFKSAKLTDPSAGTETLTITLQGGGGTLTGAGLVANADGTYTLVGSDETVTQQLDALSFTSTAPAQGASIATTFVLHDASSAGTTVDDANTIVTDNAALTFDPNAVFVGHGTFVLTGRVSDAVDVKSVEISAQIDGVATDLGTATIDAAGVFTFEDQVGPFAQELITATETDKSKGTTASVANFSLQAGHRGGRYVARQDTYAADGSSITSTAFERPNGSRTVEVRSPDQTLTSNAYDIFENHHRADTRFVFEPGFGIDVVAGFRLGGPGHDVIDLPAADFGSIADVLRNTGDIQGSAFITDPVTGDAIRVAGVTKAELVHHQADLALHA